MRKREQERLDRLAELHKYDAKKFTYIDENTGQEIATTVDLSNPEYANLPEIFVIQSSNFILERFLFLLA